MSQADDPRSLSNKPQELRDDQMTRLLTQAGHGTLTLAADSTPYALPMSFGYDRESSIYFQFGFSEGSRKRAFLDRTTGATLAVTKVLPPTEWESVIAAGDIGRVTSDEEQRRAFGVLHDNAWFPTFIFNDPETFDLELYRLDVKSTTGYRSRE